MFITYAGIQLPKYTPWLPDFNWAIEQMRAGVNLSSCRLVQKAALLETISFQSRALLLIGTIGIKYLNNLASGGLIYHFYHDPIQLEITMDYLVYILQNQFLGPLIQRLGDKRIKFAFDNY